MAEIQNDSRQPADAARAITWLEAKWTRSRACPICGGEDWGISDAHEIRQFNGGNLVVGGGTSLMALNPVTCATCGYTFLINALIAMGEQEQGEL